MGWDDLPISEDYGFIYSSTRAQPDVISGCELADSAAELLIGWVGTGAGRGSASLRFGSSSAPEGVSFVS